MMTSHTFRSQFLRYRFSWYLYVLLFTKFSHKFLHKFLHIFFSFLAKWDFCARQTKHCCDTSQKGWGWRAQKLKFLKVKNETVNKFLKQTINNFNTSVALLSWFILSPLSASNAPGAKEWWRCQKWPRLPGQSYSNINSSICLFILPPPSLPP